MATHRRLVGGALVVVAIAIGIRWSRHAPPVAPVYHPVAAGDHALGAPRADLTPQELAAFQAGFQHFVEVRPEVGPHYFGNACVRCHLSPTVGGEGPSDMKGLVGQSPDSDGTDVAGYPTEALPGWEAEAPPADAQQRIPPPLFGLGLIEQIPDETIRAACGKGHFQEAKLLGSDPPNQVARFGYKPYLGTIVDFLGDVLRGAMSLTNPIDNSSDEDDYPDPEVDLPYMKSLAAFVRGLAPPARDGTDAEGEAAFHSFGCATCHVPDMPPAYGVFSDFCLHGMGEGLADGIKDHTAQGDEFRTMRLWGLRFRSRYLHDGRARSLEAAITAHGGEAAGAVEAFQQASAQQRAALLRFLRTL